ncbi:hypothetical protein ATCC90586_001109 [Pythium insidiosum]|nr:hypothetical protein ATCC90586_001109 [Pythium insidiosum]
MEISVITEALQQLHSPHSTPRVRRRADSFLQRFQRSPEASPAALHVLQAPIVADGAASVAPLVRVERAFAASTLYTTVASYVRKYKLDDAASWTPEERAMHEAVTAEFGALCQQVWDVLSGPGAILEELNVQTSLALTVAVILLRFHEQHSESTFVSAVEWLVTNQKRPMSETGPCDVTNFAILLTLKVIPEEVENKRVKFTKAKRLECELLVQRAAPHVVQQVLPSIAATIDAHEESQGRLRGLLLQCLASWVEFGNVSSSLLLESGLLSRAFRETMVPPFSEDAFAVIREVVRVCKSDAHVPLMTVVMKEFVNLGRHVREMLATAPQNVAFCIKNCATAISECGQAFITYFVDYALDPDSRNLVFELLETILSFTAINDMETSNETMDFWVDFRAYISGKHEDRMQEFEVFISRLLNILVERTVFPDDFEALSAVAKDQFGVYRNDVRAVFRSLATVSVASEDRFIIDAIHAIFHQQRSVVWLQPEMSMITPGYS